MTLPCTAADQTQPHSLTPAASPMGMRFLAGSVLHWSKLWMSRFALKDPDHPTTKPRRYLEPSMPHQGKVSVGNGGCRERRETLEQPRVPPAGSPESSSRSLICPLSDRSHAENSPTMLGCWRSFKILASSFSLCW